LVDQYSKPIKYAVIVLESVGIESMWGSSVSLMTNEYGIFSKAFTSPAPGTYVIRMRYNGSPIYEPCYSDIALIVQ
jgi:hypothetical protein